MSEQTPPVDERPQLLVIDDDLVQRKIISKLGAQAGFGVTGAATFDEAEAALHSRRFDCITLDLALGTKSGVMLLNTIRDTGNLAPVVIVSGAEPAVLGETVNIARSLSLNAQFMGKPLDLVELRGILAKKQGSALAVRGNVEISRSLTQSPDQGLMSRISSVVRSSL